MNTLHIDDQQTRVEKLEAEITELKSEIAILQNIIALIPGNVYWKNKEGEYRGCNNNVAKILGLNSPKDIIGKHNRDLFNKQISAPLDEIDLMIKTNASEKYIEEFGINIDGKQAIYLSKKLPLLDEKQGVIGILGVSFDITDRKKMEEDLKIAKEKAEISNHTKSQFLAVVNHELRTPLTCIVGLSDLLKNKALTKAEKQKIGLSIENCAQHLLGLVNEVLDFSKLEMGKYNIKRQAVNLAQIFQEVYDLLLPIAANKALALELIIKDPLPPSIMTDARIIRQILINLINNAIKFTDKGHVSIVVTVLCKTAAELTLNITVIDTGHGIPADKIGLIFEPFEQLEDAYTRQSSRSGTGLGLTIVEKLAASLDLRVSVKSEPGIGSKFSIEGKMPYLKDMIKAPIKKKANTLKKTLDKKLLSTTQAMDVVAPTILLVEDDPIIRYVHETMLTELGYQVIAVECGHDALHVQQKYDIALIDISLPDINGFEVIRKLRTAKQDIAIVALTVFTGKEEKAFALQSGANSFASKPISQLKLEKVIAKHLGK